MNHPLTPLPDEIFNRVAIALIDLDVRNHRLVATPDDDAKLQKAIKTNGIQQPIKVNQKPDGRYTLVFGFRRLAAATALGMETVPALIVSGLTTVQIQALQAIENLDRKELHPLEEAQFCEDLAETLLEQHEGKNGNPDSFKVSEAIAQQIGRSITWVERRLAMARLSERVKQAFLAGDIGLGHVNLIARLASHEAQEEVLGQVEAHTPPHYVNESPKRKLELKRPAATLAETRKLVEERQRDLSNVPWELDAVFGGKLPCTECAHNSANRLDLFPEEIPQTPQCLLASCFAEKTKVASRAVQKATNTTLKNSEEPTPEAATEAIAEREVTFVKPTAVVEAAKRRQDSTTPTQAEKRGATRREQEEKIHKEFMKRLHGWQNRAIDAIYARLPLEDHLTVAMMMVIYNSSIINMADGEAEGEALRTAQKKLSKAVDLLVGPHKISKTAANHPLAQLIDLLAPELTKEYGNDDDPLNLNDFWGESLFYTMDTLLQRLDVTIDPPRKSREEIAEELYPTKED